MVRMKCVKALTYAGQKLKPGDPFNARGNKDARVLVAIGKAVRVSVSNFAPAKILPPVAVALAPVQVVEEAPTEQVSAEGVRDEVDASLVKDIAAESVAEELPELPVEDALEASAQPAIVKPQTRRRNQSGAGKK